MASAAAPVQLVEVSPRDGLQNEKALISTADKVELIRRATAAGARRIEVTSFVHPKRVPQMADAEAVVAALPRTPGVEHIGLVLNVKGAERALATAVDELGAVCIASDVFGQTNQGQDIEQSLLVTAEIIALAKSAGRSAQATIGVAFGCPFTGAVDPSRVADIARRLAAMQPREIALADTIGVARPGEVTRLIAKVREAAPGIPLRVHFHDTRGTGVANVMAAVAAGVGVVDASIAGVGGCPFAPAASGNVATEDVIYALDGAMDVDLDAAIDTARWLAERLGKPVQSALARSGPLVPRMPG